LLRTTISEEALDHNPSYLICLVYTP